MMEDRKAELERKKERLRQIREERKKKEDLKRQNVSHTDVSDVRQTPDDLSKDSNISGTSSPLTIELENPETPVYSAMCPIGSTKMNKNLQISEIMEIVIPPPETIACSKEVQTSFEYNERENRSTDYYVLTYDESGREVVDANAALAELEKMPHVGLTKSGTIHKSSSKLDNRQLLLNETKERLSSVENSSMESPQLTEEEKRHLLSSDNFLRFLERSSRVVERALNYSNAVKPQDFGDEEQELIENNVHINISQEFYSERWTKHRTVTGLDWSTLFPELLLAAYHLNEDAAHGPEGVCLIWNMKYPDKCTPEYVFHCQSAVTSASLSKFHPNIVVAGTYCGQIVLWDSRVNKRTPVQYSPLSSSAHTHPVFAITLVGTQNAHNIISLGSDGSLCAWSLDMLTQPREKSRVCEAVSSGLFEPYPTCMSFFANDVNNYVIGAENGNAYCGQRHSSRTGVSEEATRHSPYKGHVAPLTAVSTHPNPGTVNFSSLFLTASLDWTVRLWSTREHKPLYTFEDYSDYVYDVCWSTVHPAVFAAVDGTGRLDIWNVNENTELPSARLLIGAPGVADNSSCNNSLGAALNKCRWNNTGTHIAAGDDCGRVFVCNIHESLSQPNPEDWSRFVHTLADLKQYDIETDIKPTC